MGLLKVLSEIDLIGDDHPQVLCGHFPGGRGEFIGLALQVVPPVPECADDLVGIAPLKCLVPVHIQDDLLGFARLGIASQPLVPVQHRVPLHQQPASVHAGPPVDVVLPVFRIRDLGYTAADAFPAEGGSGACPQRSQPERERLVLHGIGQAKTQAVPPFQASGIIHSPENGFCRRAAQADAQRIQREADMPVPDTLNETLKFGRGFGSLIDPGPVAPVAIPTALELGRLVPGLVHQVQVIVQHRDEDPFVGLQVGGPEQVGMVIRRDIDALALELLNQTGSPRVQQKCGQGCPAQGRHPDPQKIPARQGERSSSRPGI